MALFFLSWGALLPERSAEAGSLPVVLASSLVKVPRTGLFPTMPALELDAARGEFESAQIVLRNGDAPLPKIEARASLLLGPDGATLQAPRLYRVGYVQVTTPSNIEGRAGWWPDPLIPAVDAYAGEVRPAFGEAVEAWQNQPFWVEVYVPRDAKPGVYHGTVTLEAGLRRKQIPLRVRVRSFVLPATPSLPLLVGFSGISVQRAHHGHYLSEEDNYALSARYALALLRHRATPIGGTMLPPAHTFEKGKVHVDWARYDAEVGPLLEGKADPLGIAGAAQMIELRLPGKLGQGERDALVAAWVAHFRARGWLGKLFDYTWDEPNPKDFDKVKERAAAIGRARIPRFVTHPYDERLRGSVDIWGTEVNLLDEKPLSQGGSPKARPRSAYGPGTRLFWYQACLSHGCDIVGGRYFTGWPSLVIDAPTAVAHRILEWLTWRYGIEGELYYNSVEAYNVGDPWENARTHGGNGDGTLFYPGTPARIGGKAHVPIESIRLKLLRDGAEDYEYLALAGRPLADREALRLARRAFDWNHDAAALLAARKRLADAIEGGKGRRVAAAHP